MWALQEYIELLLCYGEREAAVAGGEGDLGGFNPAALWGGGMSFSPLGAWSVLNVHKFLSPHGAKAMQRSPVHLGWLWH